ncbi:MAG TPA: ATPase [Desulfotomaculum sp.]|nr:ATPase [Desulfotomaculum sp.]
MNTEGKNFFDSIENVMNGLMQQTYLVKRHTATTVFLSGRLGKPLLVEGPAGVGKTALASAMAGALGTQMIRLQCYPGLDESKTLYEWNYQKQLLHVQMQGSEADIFGPEFMLERPLLKAFRSSRPVVLLVDEIDKSEEELESFLLEALDDFQVTIPECGTVTANHRPYVVITSNRMRELSDALKRRCLYLHIDYPDQELERAVLNLRLPGIAERLTADIVDFVQQLRRLKLKKAPSIAESLDWARTLLLLGRDSIDPDLTRETLNVLLKYEDDIKVAAKELPTIVKSNGFVRKGEHSAGVPDEQTTTGGCNDPKLDRFDF